MLTDTLTVILGTVVLVPTERSQIIPTDCAENPARSQRLSDSGDAIGFRSRYAYVYSAASSHPGPGSDSGTWPT